MGNWLTLFVARLAFWLRSRDWLRLLLAIPAMGMAVFTTILAVLIGSESNQALARWYVEQSREASNAKDWSKAVMFAESAARFDPTPAQQMHLANMSLGSGDHPRGVKIIQSLACPGETVYLKPPKRRAYPPAHLALGRLLMEQPRVTPEIASLAEKHLLLIVDLDGEEATEAHLLLGKLYMARGRPHWAVPHLRHAAPRTYDRVLLATAAAQCGEAALAEIEAGLGQEWLAAVLADNPRDAKAAQMMAECRCIQKRFDEAIRGLDEAIAAVAADEIAKLKRQQADVFVRWLDHLGRDAHRSGSVQLQVLETALRYAPGDRRLLMKLVEYINPPTPNAERAIELIEEQLAQGNNIGLAHMLLGNYAWLKGDIETARLHMDQAHRALPQSTSIANNLAWLLAHQEPPALEKALQTVQMALDQAPDNPEYRNTRGVILKKMKRYKEALPDLEHSVAGSALGDRPAIHANLAELYQVLGDARLAELHRIKAAQYKAAK